MHTTHTVHGDCQRRDQCDLLVTPCELRNRGFGAASGPASSPPPAAWAPAAWAPAVSGVHERATPACLPTQSSTGLRGPRTSSARWQMRSTAVPKAGQAVGAGERWSAAHRRAVSRLMAEKAAERVRPVVVEDQGQRCAVGLDRVGTRGTRGAHPRQTVSPAAGCWGFGTATARPRSCCPTSRSPNWAGTRRTSRCGSWSCT